MKGEGEGSAPLTKTHDANTRYISLHNMQHYSKHYNCLANTVTPLANTELTQKVPLCVGIQGPETSGIQQGPESGVWCVKSLTRAIAALKKFSMKRDFMSLYKFTATQHGGVQRPTPNRLLIDCKTVTHRDAAESQAVVMSAALHRWADWSQKRYADLKYT